MDVSLLLTEVFLICKIAGFIFPGFIMHSDVCTLSQNGLVFLGLKAKDVLLAFFSVVPQADLPP